MKPTNSVEAQNNIINGVNHKKIIRDCLTDEQSNSHNYKKK